MMPSLNSADVEWPTLLAQVTAESSRPGSAYRWMMLGATVVSLVFWVRLGRRDSRLLYLWLSALIGAFAGAKVAYIVSEGWRDWGQPNLLQRWLTGKSVLGALLGGYATVEGVKLAMGYRKPTGDWFAMIVPFGIALGRIGCWVNGCCLGHVCEHPAWWTVQDVHGAPRWPAVPLEFLFNVTAGLLMLLMKRAQVFPGNLFHLYLVAYGLFRFAHEFFRDTPRILGPFSGYALLALALTALGAIRFHQRHGYGSGVATLRGNAVH